MLLRFLGFFLDVSEIMPKFVPVFIETPLEGVADEVGDA